MRVGTPIPARSSLAARGDTTPARLVIEAIGLDQQIEAVGLDSQRMPVVPPHLVGWYDLSAQPGQGENIVLWGHVLRFKATPEIPAPFARLHELAVGAPITVMDAAGKSHRYRVTWQTVVAPDRVDYMLPKGSERLTLISCFGDLVITDRQVDMTQRLITIAEPAP
jgi:LPXTG-site transpeptidase (sortase) family protein